MAGEVTALWHDGRPWGPALPSGSWWRTSWRTTNGRRCTSAPISPRRAEAPYPDWCIAVVGVTSLAVPEGPQLLLRLITLGPLIKAARVAVVHPEVVSNW